MPRPARQTLWERLRRFLRRQEPAPRRFELDQELLNSLEGLADQVAADLLSTALDQLKTRDALVRHWQSLSPREQQVTALICLGYKAPEIARRLGVTPGTIRSHARSVLKKFGLHSQSELRLCLAEWDFSAWTEGE